MITVTLNPDQNPETKTFDQQKVTIGHSPSGESDISLLDTSLKPVHVKINIKKERVLAINVTNDPFVTSNGLPFRRKTLSPGDILEIRDSTLRFDDAELPQETHTSPVLPDEESTLLDIGDEEAAEHTLVPEIPSEVPSAKEWKSHPEKDDLEFSTHTRWKVFLTAAMIIVLLTITTSGIFYLKAAGISSIEEKRAARTIADISMALNYAKVNNITPHKRQWSNPDFLKKSLSSILPPEYPPLAHVDSQGNFSSSPYILRIYTSHDLSRFLVMAQPAPSMFQWLIPKAAIIVDSKTMDLRKTTDLKTLNRLLVQSEMLEGETADEISAFVQQSTPIPLAFLTEQKLNRGFTPPPELQEIYPGAENLIFNAPRYYPFSAPFLAQAVDLLENPGSSSEVSQLQNEMESLAGLGPIILYAPEGVEMAAEAEQALSTFVPGQKFMIGYLDLGSNGQILASALLSEGESPLLATSTQPSADPLGTPGAITAHLMATLPKTVQIKEKKPVEKAVLKNDEIDRNHPLFLQLTVLLTSRQHVLEPLNKEISLLLNEQTQGIVNDFDNRFQNLLETYEGTDREQKEKMRSNFFRLQNEYSAIPMDTFMTYVDAAGLLSFAEEVLVQQTSQTGGPEVSEAAFLQLLAKIEQAKGLPALAEAVQEMTQLLTLERLPYPDLLTSYQHKTRATVLTKLDTFLLSAEGGLAPTAFDDQGRVALFEVLKTSWITGGEERDFYMEEFDLLTLTHPHS